MAEVTVWRAVEFKAALRAQLGKNLQPAADNVADQISLDISVPGPPRSLPGEPPRVDKGVLIFSYKAMVDPINLRAYVGSDVEYSIALELGTERIKARPHVVRGLLRATQAFMNTLVR